LTRQDDDEEEIQLFVFIIQNPKSLAHKKIKPEEFSLRQRIFVWCKKKISNELAHGNKPSRVALQRGEREKERET
jgi:hypothetical protein